MDKYQDVHDSIKKLLQLEYLEKLPLTEFEKVLSEVPMGIGQLVVRNMRLVITYDKQRQGLHHFFSTDEEIRDFIANNPKVAFSQAICVHSSDILVLNIASTENYGAFEWEQRPELLEKQLSIFMPLIQKFIEYALLEQLQVYVELVNNGTQETMHFPEVPDSVNELPFEDLFDLK